MVLEAPSPAAGVLVPPGEYQVRVTAGDLSATRPFVVRADPRAHGRDAGRLRVAVRAVAEASRRDQPRQRSGAANPRGEGAPRQIERGAGRGVVGDRGGALPGQESQPEGQDRVSHPVERPPRGTPGHRPDGRRCAAESAATRRRSAHRRVVRSPGAARARPRARRSARGPLSAPCGSRRSRSDRAQTAMAAEEGVLDVPENRAKPGSRTIGVHFIRIRGTRPTAAPIFFFRAGPVRTSRARTSRARATFGRSRSCAPPGGTCCS